MPSNNENPTFLILQAAARQQQGQKETASSQSTQKVQTTTNQRTPNTKELSGKDILRAIANPLGTLSNQVSPKAKAGIGIANSVGKLPGYARKNWFNQRFICCKSNTWINLWCECSIGFI